MATGADAATIAMIRPDLAMIPEFEAKDSHVCAFVSTRNASAAYTIKDSKIQAQPFKSGALVTHMGK